MARIASNLAQAAVVPQQRGRREHLLRSARRQNAGPPIMSAKGGLFQQRGSLY